MGLGIFFEREGFVEDLATGEEVERHCEEEWDHHEAFSDGHAGCGNWGHDDGANWSLFDVFFEEEIAWHSDEGIDDDLCDVDSVEDLI